MTQGSDAHKAQQIASLARTWPNDLPLAPNYGIANSQFATLSPSEIAAQISAFHPDITIENVSVFQTKTGRDAVEVAFTSVTKSGDQ